MRIKLNSRSFFIFDLDDTLFPELDYLKSAYRHIARKLQARIPEEGLYEKMLEQFHDKANVFNWILENYREQLNDIDLEWLLKEYREHIPAIQLTEETDAFLKKLKYKNIPTGLITDGRSITQRHKLKALNIEHLFNDIIISEEFGSEKPDPRNYLYFSQKYPGKEFYFFGDNTKKDFIVPATLNWTLFCLKDAGTNIHKQNLSNLPSSVCIIHSFSELDLN